VRSLKLKSLAFALLVSGITIGVTSHASAQAASDDAAGGTPITSHGHRINGNVAGTVGLGLLGAELGLILTPAFGLQDQLWAWIVFPSVFAAGGAVAGGLAFEPHSPPPAVTTTLIGVGIGLIIPAIVGAIALKDRRRSKALENRMEGGGAIRLSKKGADFHVPSMGPAPVYSAAEMQRFGVAQRSHFLVSLVSGRF
jgi:hypothetical protein